MNKKTLNWNGFQAFVYTPEGISFDLVPDIQNRNCARLVAAGTPKLVLTQTKDGRVFVDRCEDYVGPILLDQKIIENPVWVVNRSAFTFNGEDKIDIVSDWPALL